MLKQGATVTGPVLRSTPGGPHLPPNPLPLPRCGRGRGMPPHLAWISGRGYVVVGCGRARGDAPAPRLDQRAWLRGRRPRESKGQGAPHLSPSPFLSFTGSGSAEVRVAMAILRLRLSTIPRIPRSRPPRSRAAGAGPGVRAARSAARMCDGWRNRTLAPNAVVARVRYVPNEKSEFLITLLEMGGHRHSLCHANIGVTR